LLLAHTRHNDAMPISWSDAKDFKIGTWMCAFDQGKPKSPSLPLRLGNISAHRRGIRGGAALGVEMANDAPSEAVRIVDLGVESPAEKAGLQRNDLILAIDDVKVTSMDILRVELDQHAAGDRVKLGVRRETEERSVEVRLGSHSTVTSNWTGEDYANGGVSLRTDNFADVIQHQMPLSPRDMGGPLLDLDGKAVGINIARADRVTTFALPVSAFWGKVQEWIVQARKAGHEEVRSAEVVEDK
jgi:S1-C subfamily serine protease